MNSEKDDKPKLPQTLTSDGSVTQAYAEELQPAGALPNGIRVGEYSVRREISRGAMGVVYEAQHDQLQRAVALKMILAGRFAGERQLARFRTEAEAAAALDHPHIVPIYDIGSVDGNAYFTMKLLNGGDLSRHVNDFVNNPRKTAELMLKISRAVHFAHQRGILHRDLKPANILFDQNGEPFIADFGLAKRFDESGGERRPEERAALTESGMVVGTPAYMSPEQAAGSTKTITTSTDVYSLGAILYELLTGRVPFSGNSLLEILTKVQTETPIAPRKVNAQIDAGLSLICMKCLEKDPAGRYESAEALALDLDRWLHNQPLSVNSGGVLFRMFHWVRTNTKSAVWSVGIGLALALSLYAIIDRATGERDSIRKVYEHFPSLKAPIRTDPTPAAKSPFIVSWSVLVLLAQILIVAVLMTSWGLILVRLTRAKTYWDDLFAGLISGSAAVTALLFLCSGWVVALFLNHSAIGKDMRLVAGQLDKKATTAEVAEDDATRERHVQEAIVARYEDMKKIPAMKRRELLMEKVLIDIQYETPRLLALYLIGLCSLFMGAAVSQSMAAGLLIRRGDSKLRMILPYFELSLAWFIAIFLFCSWLSAPLAGQYVLGQEKLGLEDVPEELLSLVPSLVAIVGTAVGWRARRRLLAYAVWFVIHVGVDTHWKNETWFVALPVLPLALYEFEWYRQQTTLRKCFIFAAWFLVWFVLLVIGSAKH